MGVWGEGVWGVCAHRVCGRGMWTEVCGQWVHPRHTQKTATEAGGMHPTAMHSCLLLFN